MTNHENIYLPGKQATIPGNWTLRLRESLEHKDVQFNDNGTVLAYLHHPLQYIPHMSNGTEEDIMILPKHRLIEYHKRNEEFCLSNQISIKSTNRQHEFVPSCTNDCLKNLCLATDPPLVTLGNKMMPSWIKLIN